MISLTNEQDVLATLARRLREERVRLGWRQVDLARRSGVPVSTLRKFEHTGQLSSVSLARLLVSLGLADKIVEALKPSVAVPTTLDEFLVRSQKGGKERQRVRASRKS